MTPGLKAALMFRGWAPRRFNTLNIAILLVAALGISVFGGCHDDRAVSAGVDAGADDLAARDSALACTLNSDCRNPLEPVCAVGKCAGCRNDADCLPMPPAGKSCSTDNDCDPGQVCSLADKHCYSDCATLNDCLVDGVMRTVCGECSTCNRQTGACNLLVVECLADSDCHDPARPRCDPSQNRCFQCSPQNDNCGPGACCRFRGGSYGCFAGCKTDVDCGIGLYCAGPCGQCVQCVSDAHCPAGQRCSNGGCTSP